MRIKRGQRRSAIITEIDYENRWLSNERCFAVSLRLLCDGSVWVREEELKKAKDRLTRARAELEQMVARIRGFEEERAYNRLPLAMALDRCPKCGASPPRGKVRYAGGVLDSLYRRCKCGYTIKTKTKDAK